MLNEFVIQSLIFQFNNSIIFCLNFHYERFACPTWLAAICSETELFFAKLAAAFVGGVQGKQYQYTVVLRYWYKTQSTAAFSHAVQHVSSSRIPWTSLRETVKSITINAFQRKSIKPVLSVTWTNFRSQNMSLHKLNV